MPSKKCERCSIGSALSDGLCAECSVEVEGIRRAKDEAKIHASKMAWDAQNIDDKEAEDASN